MDRHAVVLNSQGYLRIPDILLPDDSKDRGIYLVLAGIQLARRVIFLRAVYEKDLTDGMWARKGQYPNQASLSPIVTVNTLLEVMGVPLPQDSLVLKAKKRSDTIEVQFPRKKHKRGERK